MKLRMVRKEVKVFSTFFRFLQMRLRLQVLLWFILEDDGFIVLGRV